uniref:Phlebovirus_G2 domain-containing protein n=1 Tax=Caenorhabditis tropicalis TaxID=1561998 RepID=A0A1I7UQU2_9PELO
MAHTIASAAVQMASQYMHPGRRRAKPPQIQKNKPVKNVKPLKTTPTPCPPNQVLLEMEVNRKIIKRCQSTCPVSMRSVNGVCKIERRPPVVQ